jgi:hypothetical protein
MLISKNFLFVRVPGYRHRVLEDFIHPIDENDLQRVFVNSFPQSTTRKNIDAKYHELRFILQHMFPSEHWIDGFFVELIENPTIVDVAVIVQAADFDSLPEDRRAMVTEFINNIATQKYQTNGFLLVAYPESHSEYPYYLKKREYIKHWFSHTTSGMPKGFVSLAVPLLSDSTTPAQPE